MGTRQAYRRITGLASGAALLLGLLLPGALPGAAEAATVTPAAPVTPAATGLAQAYNNVGVTTAAAASAGNFDGTGDSLPAAGLAADALRPGQPLLHDGLTIGWPDVQPGQPDNVVADGQQITLDGTGTVLGVTGASAYGTTSGTLTVDYANGSTSTATLSFADWTSTSAAAGSDLLATTAGWNAATGSGGTTPVSLFYAAIPLTAGQRVTSVTLPAVGSGVGKNVPSMHVFSLTVGSPGQEAAGAPGAASYYDEARKDCVGTAAGSGPPTRGPGSGTRWRTGRCPIPTPRPSTTPT